MKKLLSLVLSLALAASCAVAVNAEEAAVEETAVATDAETTTTEKTTEETEETTEEAAETPAEEATEEDTAHYDETLIVISNIVSYEYDEEQDVYTANCTLPVEVTAQKDLADFTVVKYEEKEDTEEETAEEPAEETPAKKGDVIVIEEAGYYAVMAADEEGNSTAIVVYAAEEIATEDKEEVVEEVPAEEEDDTPVEAKYTSSKVMVNGAEVNFEAYNIKDNNYFKLRDIAAAINGTEKNFEVTWDAENARVALVSKTAYTVAGGELVAGDGTDKVAGKGTSDISIDGEAVTMKAYLINDNNYFKLRDLGKLFDFGVEWDGENNCVMINTDAAYAE